MSKSLCLCMIVKNESRIIERCLGSIRPWIDHWVIVDTGSTDGTQDRVRDCLRGVPGELAERPWVDFGHNRTEALRLAEPRADYLLLCDADMVLEVQDPGWRERLEADAYLVLQRYPSGFSYRNIRLVAGRGSGDGCWRYWGATHEFIGRVDPACAAQVEGLDGISYLDLGDGGAKADKFERDRRLLERQLADLLAPAPGTPPGHPDLLARTHFYLAQTYRDLGLAAQAREMYRRRAALGGWDEEVWYSLLEIARQAEKLQRPPAEVVHGYLEAFQFRPRRAEPLVDLARYHRLRRGFALAHLFARQALEIPMPQDTLFLEEDCYRWRALDEYAIACYWVGQRRASWDACERLLASGQLPADQVERVRRNQLFSQSA